MACKKLQLRRRDILEPISGVDMRNMRVEGWLGRVYHGWGLRQDRDREDTREGPYLSPQSTQDAHAGAASSCQTGGTLQMSCACLRQLVYRLKACSAVSGINRYTLTCQLQLSKSVAGDSVSRMTT